MRFSRAAALSLLSGIGAASSNDCSPFTTTIFQPTTITLTENSIITSTVTIEEVGGYGGGSETTIYQSTTITTKEPFIVTSIVTLGEAGGYGAGNGTKIYQTVTLEEGSTAPIIYGAITSSLKSFATSTPIISGTESLLGAQVTSIPSLGAPITQVNVISGISTVQVCPTGASTYDCTEVVYGSDGEVIVVNIITVDVTIDFYGEASTVKITRIASAASTPSLPDTSSAGFLGTKTRKPSLTGKPTGGEPYPYGNGSHPIYPTGTLVTGTSVSHKPTKTEKPSKPTHVVSVGQNGTLSFSPHYLDAEEGETVRFKFYPTNHTLTSCDVAAPCIMNGVYDSGFKPLLAEKISTFVDFPVTNATNPIFFFSRQKDECEAGMVFAINPKSKKQYDEFVSAAKDKRNTATSEMIRGTGLPYSHNGTYSYGYETGSSRPTSTRSTLEISVTGILKPPFPTGGSNKTHFNATGTGLHHSEMKSGFAHRSGTFKLPGSSKPSGSFKSTGSVSISGHVSSTSTLVSSTNVSSWSSYSTTSRSSSTYTPTSSINGYVPYSFPTPVASYVAQGYGV
ncbi:hypothetical protein EYC80_002552 [Monilinia laxa]|uniref:Ubiquitin 3 binding protein But2 C-terminal domain-containing protein n=1 Tax=Monilinia laxa TaxID=61186 RepID=A0A5N6K457_MONLA|nr:hypothetical protein EYC80_002552 [Monilinia laxa]